MEKEVLKVNGMSCTHCKKSIENALKEIGRSEERRVGKECR